MSLTCLVDRTSAKVVAAPIGPEVEEVVDKSTHSDQPATQSIGNGDQTSKANEKSPQKKHGQTHSERQPKVRTL